MVTDENRALRFRTQRLAMRCLTIDDAPIVQALGDHPVVLQYMYLNPWTVDPKPWTVEEVQIAIEKRLASNHLHMLMTLLPEDQHLPTPEGSSPYDPHLAFPAITSDAIAGTPIGNLGLKDNYEIGYMVTYEHWGKGYTAEALAGLLREIWKASEKGKLGTLPHDTSAAGKETEPAEGREYVAAATNPSNRRSMRVLEKTGFLRSGSKDVEDFAQTKEDKETNGVKMFQLNYFKKYKPDR